MNCLAASSFTKFVHEKSNQNAAQCRPMPGSKRLDLKTMPSQAGVLVVIGLLREIWCLPGVGVSAQVGAVRQAGVLCVMRLLKEIRCLPGVGVSAQAGAVRQAGVLFVTGVLREMPKRLLVPGVQRKLTFSNLDRQASSER